MVVLAHFLRLNIGLPNSVLKFQTLFFTNEQDFKVLQVSQ